MRAYLLVALGVLVIGACKVSSRTAPEAPTALSESDSGVTPLEDAGTSCSLPRKGYYSVDMHELTDGDCGPLLIFEIGVFEDGSLSLNGTCKSDPATAIGVGCHTHHEEVCDAVGIEDTSFRFKESDDLTWDMDGGVKGSLYFEVLYPLEGACASAYTLTGFKELDAGVVDF